MSEHKHAAVFLAAARGEVDEFEVHGFGWPKNEWQPASTYPNLDCIYNKPGSWESRRKQKMHVVNGFTVPEPLRENPNTGFGYYVEMANRLEFDSYAIWGNTLFEEMLLSRGLIHTTKEGAIANCKARLGIDPYKDES